MIRAHILGGAMLPHAPQFFTLPKTEDMATVQRVRDVAATIGARLRALSPDLWLVIANDHAEQFFHNVAPPFTDFKTPAPSTESEAVFPSPSPTYTVASLKNRSAPMTTSMLPIDNETSKSLSGVQVAPLFVVFQTPPPRCG